MVVSVLLIAGGAVMLAWPFVVMALVPPAYLYMIGRRLSVDMDDERLAYQGWLGLSDVKWQDIVSVTRTLNLPYPRDRDYGPLCYEVRTKDRRFVVNLLYFPPEFAKAFAAQVARRRLLRRRGTA
jgi:hypothetical protein